MALHVLSTEEWIVGPSCEGYERERKMRYYREKYVGKKYVIFVCVDGRWTGASPDE